MHGVYEGVYRCSSIDEYARNLRPSVWTGTHDQKQAVEDKIAERMEKCTALSKEMDSKNSQIAQARLELVEAEKLVSEMLQNSYGRSGENSVVNVASGFPPGCYKISSGLSPLHLSKVKTGRRRPPSGTFGVEYSVGRGAVFYLHSVSGYLANVSMKSGSFDTMAGWIDTAELSIVKTDGKNGVD